MSEQPAFTPPGWLNSLMKLMLRTPGLQWLVGRSTALIRFTGRKSGRLITTPVSYARDGNRVIISAHRSRQWWRNVKANPAVELRLAGRTATGTAEVLTGASALDDYACLLSNQRMMARAAGVGFERAGHPNRDQLRAVLPDTVVVVVNLAPASVRSH